jgi:general secretion pathway protein I
MPLPHPSRRSDRGFTLLEMLIAIGIIAFAFVGLLGLHARNIGMTIRDQNMTRATLLARHKVSEIEFQARTEGIEAVSGGSGTFEGYPGYAFDVQVEPTELDMVRRVVVRVFWDERYPDACRVVYFVRGELL